ncbi:MAG TPA: hypothetical protein PKW14_13040, partial [Bacteroidota bacterium]|nr:hypothetical protein [Bacteroidota bacterium]
AHIAFVAQQLGYVKTLNSEQVKKLMDIREKLGIKTKIECLSCETDSSCNNNQESYNQKKSDEELIQKITAEVIKQLSK